MDEEEFEHVPWANLVAQTDDRRTRIVYVGIAVAAAAVIGVLGMRWLSGPDQVAPLPEATPAVSVVPPVAPAAPAVPAVPGVPAAPLPTEADLLAALPRDGGGEALAVMRAEWFITDYFTVDHDPMTTADVSDAFAPGTVLPRLPHEEAAGTSYVEWARAYRVVPQGQSAYAVWVAFRSIYADGQGFRRGPVRAAEVLIDVGAGGAAVVDLPAPVPPPRAHGLTPASLPQGPAPQAAIDAALGHAWLFDADPQVLEATADGARWRVVVGLSDASGISWPMVIRPGVVSAGMEPGVAPTG